MTGLGVKSPLKEGSRREIGKANEESSENKKEPTEVKLKHRDELRVTQVRRAPSERIGMAVKLRDNAGTPESKVKRRMVSSDCSPSESQAARLQQEPIAWLSGVKSKDTGSKILLEAKTKKEDIKVQDVKIQEKSGAPEETTKKRSSSEGASAEEILVLSTQKDDAANDDTTTADDTEFSQMFNKLRHKTYKKVKAPGDEKENAVLKTTAKDALVVTSSQKPPLADADSNAGVTVDDPGKANVATGTKTVLVIEKTVPKTSSKLESPSEGSLPKRSSPLLKDRTRRQTLPVSPSQSRALSPEEEDSKVKRSVSQRKPTEPSPLASSPPSSTTSIIRASTAAQMEPKKLFSNDDDTSSSAPPWAAMARKKTSKFEQNKKLNKSVDVKSENVSAGADSKPEPVTTTPAVVDMSSSKTGYSNTESTSSAATKPVVLIIAAKPATTNVATTGVSSSTSKPVVSSMASKTTVSSTTTKPQDSSVTSKSATTTTPAASVPKTTGSSTVFASSVKSNAPAVSKPATNVVITRKKSDEKKAGEVR